MPQPSQPTVTRRNVWTLPSGDPTLEEYAEAVAIMRARPATQVTSWSYQAAMHGTVATPQKPLWNGCQHFGWYFLPWHRMFIYYFEQIVRAAVVQAGGSPHWTLPYWDYGAGGQQATLPHAFRHATLSGGAHNPLFVSQRAPGINTGSALSSAVASPAHALSRPHYVGVTLFGGGQSPVVQFDGATGAVEQTPHNDVHNAVGGQSGWMADPDRAAADPIFWLHHANIDRLWWKWTGAGHSNPTDPAWRNQSFSFFDAHGTKVHKSCVDVRLTAQLGYTYEDAGAQPSPAAQPQEETEAMSASSGGEQPPEPEPELLGASEAPLQLVGTPAAVGVPIDHRSTSQLARAVRPDDPSHVYLSIDDIDAERNPGTVYGVYVNLPDGASPEEAERHHAGNVSFFGVERARNPRADEHPHSVRVVHDITELSGRLQAAGEWDPQHVHVTFRPLGLIPPDEPQLAHAVAEAPSEPDPPVTIGRVSILSGD
jgi:tyrosinase